MPHARTSVRFGVWNAGPFLAPALALILGACSGGTQSNNSGSLLPANVQSIIFLQRVPRDSDGNVFDYQSFVAGGRIVKLEPPAANGTLTNLTADPMFANADFMSWDLSFDAQTIVFSARLAGADTYQVFSMNVDGTNPQQLTDGTNDYVYPIFLPGGKVLFMTNQNVETDANQFQDEYERAETAQVGTMNLDGSAQQLGPRNVSHRVAPALLPDGHVLYTEWMHLGDVNEGHLRQMNADMTSMREAFGGELRDTPATPQPGTNSYLRGRPVNSYQNADGTTSFNVVTIGTSRDRTLQAGKILLADLAQSEATSSYVDLTPTVPADRTSSMDGVGRYYDAELIGPYAGTASRFLVSWSDGPVQSEELALANTNAKFGLYVYTYDAKNGVGTRYPLYDDPNFWDVQARPVMARPEPVVTASPIQGQSFVVSALNVYNTSLTNQVVIPAGTAVKARLIEGFSGEEGIRTFGSTEFDGQSLYGEIPIQTDGSFSAQVPANVPVHIQVLDKFAIALAEEPIWISGRAGEQRTCGGCHESRSVTSQITPGQTMAGSLPPVNLDVPRAQRISTNYTYGNVRGVPWDLAIQPIFDAKCVSCHNGDASNAANPQFTVTDTTAGTSQTFVFDLRGQKVDVMVGEKMTGAFTASYLSIFGLGELIGEHAVTYTGTPFAFGLPADAQDSPLITLLNPPQQFPAVDTTVRRYPGMPIHPTDVGGTELTPTEYYLLGLSVDMGGQFFSRENADEAAGEP